MTRGLVFLFLACAWCCTSTSPSDATKSVGGEAAAEDLEKRAFEIYQDDPLRAVHILVEAAEKYRSEKDIAKAAVCYLNAANIQDE